jgi:hypothetical protein
MRYLVFIVAVACLGSSVSAQRGPDYPKPGADRGSAFPKDISPTDSNPTNWIAQKPEYSIPYKDRYYRFRGRFRR